MPLVSKYADELIETELPRAVEAIGVRMLHITSDAQERGALGNSRIFIEYQTAIVDGVLTYGRTLRERLGQFEAAHSPVSTSDFDKAIASVDELSSRAMALYDKRRRNQEPWGGSGLPFDESRLAAALGSAKNELRGLQQEYASRRSTFKRWMNRGLDALGENVVFFGLLIVSAFVLGAALGVPFETVWDAMGRMGITR